MTQHEEEGRDETDERRDGEEGSREEDRKRRDGGEERREERRGETEERRQRRGEVVCLDNIHDPSVWNRHGDSQQLQHDDKLYYQSHILPAPLSSSILSSFRPHPHLSVFSSFSSTRLLTSLPLSLSALYSTSQHSLSLLLTNSPWFPVPSILPPSSPRLSDMSSESRCRFPMMPHTHPALPLTFTLES